MSSEAGTFAKRTSLGEAEGFSARLLFYIVADNLSSETGTCVMGKAELAAQMHASPTTVWRQAIILEKAGFIRVIKRSNGRQRLPDEIEIVGFKDWWSKQGIIPRPERPVSKSVDKHVGKSVDNRLKDDPTFQIERLEIEPEPSNLPICNIANCEIGPENLQPSKLQYCTGGRLHKDSSEVRKKEEGSEVSGSSGFLVPIPNPPPPETKTRRGTRLPDDWVLIRSWGEWAIENFDVSAEDVRFEAMKFANYWQSKPKDATKLNWYKAWQNWCIEAFRRKTPRGPVASHQESASATKHREGRELLEKIDRKIAEMKS